MWFAPIRIMRETLRVEASNLHWLEKVGYKIIFAAQDCENDVVDDVTQYLDRMLKQYEKETYKIRLKAYEERTKGLGYSFGNNLVTNDRY